MKKLFVILLVTVLTSCGAALEPPKSNIDYKNIIGKPIKIGNLEIAQYDFPYEMELNDAKKACQFGDDGWRLPSEDELNYLYENRASVGGFEGDVYWHSKVDDSRLWLRYFNNATMNGVFKVTSGYVRAVRALKQSAAMSASEQLAALKKPKSNTDYEKIIGKPIKIRNIEVTQYDFPEQMKWENAKKACAALGEGWRLPSQDELYILYANLKKNEIGGFVDNYYWSSSELDNNYAWVQNFGSGSPQRDFDKINKYYVRAIRAPEQSAGSPKSNTDYKNIIGKPIKIGNIEVAQYDFPELMNSEDAKKACADLGEGWKLPSQDELNDLYQNKVAIGGFVDDGYWSSTEGGNQGVWAQDFASGNKYSAYNHYKYNFRAIRAPEQSAGSPKSNTDYKNIIGKPIKIGNIEVAQYDFPEEMNREDAKIFCTNLGKGWRLPTIEELNILYQNRGAIGGFADDFYWSSKEDDGSVWTQSFNNGIHLQFDNPFKHYVRAIRAF